MAKTDETATPAAQTVPVTETPEFKAAIAVASQAAAEAAAKSVQDRVAAEVAKIMAAQQQASGSEKPEALDSFKSVLSDLAFAIAKTNDPDHGRKLISPEEQEKRSKALEKMGSLLIAVRKDRSIKPMYEVHGQTFLDEQLIQPYTPGNNNKWNRTIIIWRGAPNAALRPANDAAREIFTAYLGSIGGSTRNQAGVKDKPVWVDPSGGGLIFVGEPPKSVANRGLASEPTAPMELGADLSNPTREITSTDDPNAELIPVLGTTAQPARRVGPGNIPSLNLAQN